MAVLDVDGDRWPDLLFVNASRPARHGLYRNNRDGTFTDVSAGSGLDTADFYALGATVADYDNDGRDDVFLTSVEGGRLFHNAGSGRFVDVTENRRHRATAILPSAPRGSTTTATAWPDLFVGNYVEWSPEREVNCASGGIARLLRPGRLPAARAEALSQPRQRPFRGRDADAPGSANRSTRRWAWRFSTTTWTAGPTCSSASDRVPARLFRNDRRGGFVEGGVPAGSRAQRERPRAGEHGRGRRRLRSLGTPGSRGGQLHQRDARVVPQRRRRDSSSTSRRARRSAARACCR